MLKHTSTFDHPVDDLIALLCGEGFNLEAQNARPDVVEAKYELVEDNDDVMRFVVPYRHYRRSKTGKFDKSVIESSRTEYRMDRRTRKLFWKHVGAEEAGRIRIEGVTRFVPQGDARTQVVREVTIDIRIPLVGRTIAKYVESQFRQAYDGLEDHINEAITRLL